MSAKFVKANPGSPVEKYSLFGQSGPSIQKLKIKMKQTPILSFPGLCASLTPFKSQ